MWGRGHGNGWGQTGDLQMYLKIGRDENNFYMYRSPLNAGQTAAAWTDLVLDFQRFVALRKRVQTDYLAGKKESIACSGVDSAMIAATPLPAGVVAHRFAACDQRYMVYTIDPAVSVPNLVAVQEVAVGIHPRCCKRRCWGNRSKRHARALGRRHPTRACLTNTAGACRRR